MAQLTRIGSPIWDGSTSVIRYNTPYMSADEMLAQNRANAVPAYHSGRQLVGIPTGSYLGSDYVDRNAFQVMAAGGSAADYYSAVTQATRQYNYMTGTPQAYKIYNTGRGPINSTEFAGGRITSRTPNTGPITYAQRTERASTMVAPGVMASSGPAYPYQPQANQYNPGYYSRGGTAAAPVSASYNTYAEDVVAYQKSIASGRTRDTGTNLRNVPLMWDDVPSISTTPEATGGGYAGANLSPWLSGAFTGKPMIYRSRGEAAGPILGTTQKLNMLGYPRDESIDVDEIGSSNFNFSAPPRITFKFSGGGGGSITGSGSFPGLSGKRFW